MTTHAQDAPVDTPDGGEEPASFHVVVLAELLPLPEHSTGADAARQVVRIAHARFDEAMAEVAPSVVIHVPDPYAARSKPLRIELRFASTKDFVPDALAARVPELRTLQAGQGEPTPAPAARGPATGSSLLDSLLDDAAPGVAAPRTMDGVGASAFTRLLESVLAHPEVRRLEKAWRGLELLAARCPPGAILDAIPATLDEVDGSLETLEGMAEQTVDLVIVDHELGPSSRDLTLLARWAARAESIGAPLVTNVGPGVLGYDDLASLATTQRRIHTSDDRRAVALRSVAAKDPTRWVAVALNGPVGRTRLLHPDGAFAEPHALFVGAAYAVGALAVESFGRSGWACELAGPRSGLLAGLSLARPGGDARVSIATEAAVGENVASEVASAGVAMLTSVPNRDAAILAFAPTLYRGPVGPSGASGPAQGTLADQLFVARVSRALLQLASAIPAGTPPARAREVATLVLTEMFAGAARVPEVDARVTEGRSAMLEVSLRPRGFRGVGLEEATLRVRLP
jgi:type VI secretion system protein ImpC